MTVLYIYSVMRTNVLELKLITAIEILNIVKTKIIQLKIIFENFNYLIKIQSKIDF